MASPQLDIARVSFSAVLLRPDPTSCSRNDLDEFIGLVDATVSRCSPSNVQKSKQWILKHLVHSPARITALGKYLTALAKSFSATLAASRRARETSAKRKRLHILYLLNDVLYHVQVRNHDSSFAANLEPFLPPLIQYAAAFSNSPKHAKKIQSLVNLWDESQYFNPEFIGKLRAAIKDAPKLQELQSAANGTAVGNGAATTAKSSKDAPFVMPTMHGDASAPWYDLPAANWLPVIEPNSTRPMNPDMIKPLQFVPGPADKTLIQAVTDLLADVDRIYAKDRIIGDDPAEDIDQLGQRIIIDEITGDIISGETYYGWSRPFCEKMKRRRKNPDGSGDDRRGRSMSGSRSRSSSSSRSSARPAFKRRRTSSSRSPSRSRSRSRSHNYGEDRRERRSYGSSRSRSPPRRGWRDGRSQSRSRSQSHGHSPIPRPPPPPPPQQQPPQQPPQQQPLPYGNLQQGYPTINQPGGYHPQGPSPPVPNPPFQPPIGSFPPPVLPSEFNQFMVPPPPPPNYQGQWPPPPPSLPPGGGTVPNWMAGWPIPLPPPLPLQQQQQQQGHHYQGGGGGDYQYGRGGGRGDYRGGRGYRGGWGRGGRGW